jgi:hypothetical protein
MAANFRAAVERSRGRLICLLNDDDRLLPGFLDALVPRFEDPSIGVAFTDVYMNDGGRLRRRSPALAGGRYDDFLVPMLRHTPIICSAALIGREAWEQGEESFPLPDSILADTVIWTRAATLGWSFFYVDRPLVEYPINDPSQLSQRVEEMKEASVRLWEMLAFDDWAAERIRTERLAYALLVRAVTHIERGRLAAARADTARAAALTPRSDRARRWVTERLIGHPSLMPHARRAAHVLRRLQRALGRNPKWSGQPWQEMREHD